MAGPTASILLRTSITRDDESRIHADLARLATHIEANDFWLDDQPFLVAFGEDYPGELDDIADQGLPAILEVHAHSPLCEAPRGELPLMEIDIYDDELPACGNTSGSRASSASIRSTRSTSDR